MSVHEPASPTPSLELPVHLTRFVGRDRELDDLVRLAASTRMLTLTGAGGSGKTRLAREAVVRIAGSFARVGWVDLAPLADADLLAHQAAASLHLAERSGVSARELLIGSICDERTLLVLDNCEHIVDGCAELAEALLRACPRLAILATSREALGVASETAWLVPPLASAEAMQLFVDRAQATLPSFAVTPANAPAVAEICRRLDGIPLAIELAAARVRVLSPEQIAKRLDDAFRLLTAGSRTSLPRHRTLRATMEWSFALLGEGEQVLLQRLGVFGGSFTLDAAEAVCAGEPLEAEDILDGVAALVDKSLIVMEAGDGVARYRLLETVRQYAVERLDGGERAALEAHHALYYLALIESAAPHLFGGEEIPGLIARIGADNDNLRAATAWSVREPSRATIALRFADALFWYWYGATMGFGAGLFHEAKRFVGAALANAGDCDPELRGRALASCGLIGLAQGDYEPASRAFEESLALLREHGDRKSVIFVLSKLGAVRLMLGDLDRAWELAEEARELVEQIRPDSMLHSFVYSWRGFTARARGDFATSRAMHEANLRVGRYMKHRTVLGHGHAMLAAVELAEGRVDEAYTEFCDALPYHLDLGDGWGLALDLEGLSAVAGLRGRHVDAVKLMGAVDALRERSAVALPATDAADRARRTERSRERLGPAFDAIYAEGRALSMDEVTRLATDDRIVTTSEFRVPVLDADARPQEDDAPREKPSSLRVLALGPLQVFVGGRPIEPSAWGSARPRELLVYLMMHPDGRTKEQAGLAFWPDASAAQLRNNFHVTLHRLRKAIGNPDWVSLAHDRYRVEPAAIEEFDVADFEREVIAARRAMKRQQDGAAEQLERALERYRGDFVDGEPMGDWHIEHRDRLQRLCVDSLTELGAHFARAKEHAKAAGMYRRLLARDELNEDALRALMRSLAEAGERSQALRAYLRFAERLRAELDAEPEAETTRLAERMQSATSTDAPALPRGSAPARSK